MFLPCVYICFDAADHPLYVGQTENWYSRRNAHRSKGGSVWRQDVERVQMWEISSASDRLLMERDILIQLKPQYNKAVVSRW